MNATPVTMLLALALAAACGDDASVTPTTSDESTGDPTTSGPTLPTDPTTLDGDTTAGAECGNGTAEVGEDCDGDDLAGSDCAAEGFDGGTLTCNDDCSFDTSMCVGLQPMCGNEVVDDGEDCDGDDLDGEDCESLDMGFGEGTLACNDDCSFDTSMCELLTCGNNMAEGTEVCDGDDLVGQDCIMLGFGGGTLTCDDDCMGFDTSGCSMPSCGNDVTEGMEICDGLDLAGEDCVSLGMGFDAGTLVCNDDCMGFDTSGCSTCGNDLAEGAEACDGTDLVGEDCTTQGFAFGTLACDDTCMFDQSGCTNDPMFCSAPGTPIGPDAGVVTLDTVVVPVLGEFVTDVNVFLDANHTFVGDLEIDIRHVDTNITRRMADRICGTSEDINATFDQSAAAAPDCVVPIAIEGDVLPFESLDGFTGLPDPAGTWELSITDAAGGDGGVLNNWCVTFQTSPMDPNNCGDGVVTVGEFCDGLNVGGETCVSQGFDGGVLGCAPDCASFDTSGCSICGDGVAQPSELCDGADLAGATCASQGWAGGGVLACSVGCQFDETGCLGPQCSNDTIEAPELCDNQEIAGTTCEDLGFAGGSLSCSFPSCGFDTSECSNLVTAVCAAPAAPIDSALPTTTSTVNVPAGLSVVDVDVFVGITHTFDADLDMFLIHDATGTTVELTTDQCSSSDDLFAFFNDEADALPNCIEPVGIEGNIRPEGLLSDFDGEMAAGDWTLEITDDAGGDIGTLDEWCIYIQEG